MSVNPEALYPTLYAPATMEQYKLLSKMHGDDQLVHRFVICTEDALSEARIDEGLENLQATINAYRPVEGNDVFVRLRNSEVTERVLAMNGIEKLRGFVVPKADPGTYPTWAERIAERNANFRIMPLLESRGMTDYGYRRALLDVFDDEKHREKNRLPKDWRE